MTGKIIISGVIRDELKKNIAAHPDAVVLSIVHPWNPESKIEDERIPAAPILTDRSQKMLCFYDVEFHGSKTPDFEQVEEGIQFVMDNIGSRDVIIHCHKGKSRSSAIALGALALVYPDDSAEKLIEKLLEMRPQAAPNIIVVQYADMIAGRDGKLVQAVADHPVLTAQREAAHTSRVNALKNDPDKARKIYPEQFLDGVARPQPPFSRLPPPLPTP